MELLRIATRQSTLALAQANSIAKQIKQLYPKLRVQLMPMLTSGDKIPQPTLTVGGKGLFVKELEEALLSGRADLAVHSMKDVPANFPPGLSLSTITHRLNPQDALIIKTSQNLSIQPTKGIDSLTPGAIIGTTSLRRQAQLRAYRPDLVIKPLRGNIETRLKKLASEDYAAIVLAVSGLERLDKLTMITEILPTQVMLPACGQGALGLECRQDDVAVQQLITPLHHELSGLCVQTERYVSAKLGGSCNVPLAVYCRPTLNQELVLEARVLSPDGKVIIADTQQGLQANAVILAQRCVEAMLTQGADKFLENNA